MQKDNCALHVACKAGRHVNIIEFLATKLMEHGNPSPWLDCNKVWYGAVWGCMGS